MLNRTMEVHLFNNFPGQPATPLPAHTCLWSPRLTSAHHTSLFDNATLPGSAPTLRLLPVSHTQAHTSHCAWGHATWSSGARGKTQTFSCVRLAALLSLGKTHTRWPPLQAPITARPHEQNQPSVPPAEPQSDSRPGACCRAAKRAEASHRTFCFESVPWSSWPSPSAPPHSKQPG